MFLVNLSITSSKEFSAWPNSTKSTYIVRIVLKIPKSLWEAHMFFFSFCWASNIKPSYAPAMYGKILLSWFMSVLHAGIALYASNQVIQANPFQIGFFKFGLTDRRNWNFLIFLVFLQYCTFVPPSVMKNEWYDSFFALEQKTGLSSIMYVSNWFYSLLNSLNKKDQ